MYKLPSFILVLFLPLAVLAQGTQVEFGKNRVQYHRDFEDWLQYESDNFYIYWYGKSRNIGHTVAQLAEYDFSEIQGLLEHRINEKVQIIVYTDVTDFKQSNIGSEEAFTSVAGQTKIVGNTIFVYYDGDHAQLRRQIREGIASVYLNTMLFGANIQEVVQNAVMLNLPTWFKEGLVAYAGEAWNTTLDNQLRDAMNDRRYRGFARLAEENPRLAGHALWYYIAENFGRTTVSNLLYLTRINRSVESGFLYVMGVTYPTVVAGWESYFNKRYQEDLRGRETPQGTPLGVKNPKNYPLTQLKLHPDGQRAAYALNKLGRFRIQVFDLQQNKAKTIFRGGQRNPLQATDYNYPLLAWNPNRSELSFIYEFRDDLRMGTYDLRSGKTKFDLLDETYQRVFSMDFMDPNTLLLSGTASSQVDLFLYLPRIRQSRKLTNDFYDDRDAVFVTLRGKKGALFASNRKDSLLSTTPPSKDSTLPENTFDLFYLPLEDNAREMVRITRTPLANERSPAAIDTLYYTYLSDRSGICNQESGYLEDYIHHLDRNIVFTDGTEIVLRADAPMDELDTARIDTSWTIPIIRQRAVNFVETNYSRNTTLLHTAPEARRQIALVPEQNRYLAYPGPLQMDPRQRPRDTYFQRLRRQFSKLPEDSLRTQGDVALPVLPAPTDSTNTPLVERDTVQIPEGYLFQTAFGLPQYTALETLGDSAAILIEESRPEPPPPLFTTAFPTFEAGAPYGAQRPLHRINTTRITPYRLSFHTDRVTTQVDNTLLFEGLDNLAGNPNGFSPPPAGLLMKANIKDLFEDYELEAGVRVPTSFNGAEYFMVFDQKKNRLDQRFAFYNKNLRSTQPVQFTVPKRSEASILLGQYGLRYPLDIFQSLRATASLRQDRLTQLATDRNSLNTRPQTQQRVGLRLEYVFDNTVETALNLRVGGRIRLFAEGMKKFSFAQNGQNGFSLDDGYLGVLGLDARYYHPVLKHSILATRLAGMTSFGSEKILYYLGGVDNWLLPENNDEISAPPGNFAFQTLAANMRGFPINIRNGNSYALMNTELRVPIFRYLSRQLNSGFLRNFQAIGFFDIGTAWAGPSPFRADNPLNTSVYTEGGAGREFIFVTVNYYRDPIVAGYGVGVRSVLFGYFIRVDYGWGLETRNVQTPKLHVALGFDF